MRQRLSKAVLKSCQRGNIANLWFWSGVVVLKVAVGGGGGYLLLAGGGMSGKRPSFFG